MGSDLKRAFTEDGQRRTHIGGQALIEGVMMRGKLNWAVAVREPDGHMHSEEHPLSKKGKRAKWLSWPLVRGCVALVDSLVLGYKALEIAANHAFDDEDEQAETVAEHIHNLLRFVQAQQTATSTVKNTISRVKVSLAMGAHKNRTAVGPEGASPSKTLRFLGNTISDAPTP